VPEETSQVVIDETDSQAVALLHRLLADLAAVPSKHDVLYRKPPPANSVLAGDNASTNPNQIGHFVGYCMLQAADTCRSITLVVRSEGQIMLPIMSVFTLARSVIESAATAVWVLRPEDRRTRVLRRLQFAHSELTHETELVKLMASSLGKSEEQSALRNNAKGRKAANGDMRAIADANGIDYAEYENQFPGWLAIVEEAGEELSDISVLPSVWRMCSGMSHPSMKRGISLLKFDQVSESGNVLSGTFSVSTLSIVSVLAITCKITEAAMTRWRLAKVQVNPERPVASPVLPRR
jgi:hypothetical protein